MTNTPPPSRDELVGSIPDDDQPFYGPDDEPLPIHQGREAQQTPAQDK